MSPPSERHLVEADLDRRAADAGETVLAAVGALQPLLNALPRPVRVGLHDWKNGTAEPRFPAAQVTELQPLLDAATTALGVPPLNLHANAAPDTIDIFEQAVSQALADAMMAAARSAADGRPSAGAVQADVRGRCEMQDLAVSDGARIHAYRTGPVPAPAIVIASACGMPVALSARWLRALSGDFNVVTWETRGLFGEAPDFDRCATDVRAQAADLIATLDRFGITRAHVMGFCGGAVIALAAAATHPGRIDSLSLWHGDFEAGSDCPKSDHQRQIRALLALAAGSRRSAASIHEMFRAPAWASKSISFMKHAPAEVAPLVLYPYATAELLHRYAKLNSSLMSLDVSPLLRHVNQPTLVVTSHDDDTVHPEGSHVVARQLREATLHVWSTTNHLSLFRAPEELVALVRGFVMSRADGCPS